MSCTADDLPSIRPRIVAAEIAALEVHIPRHEAERVWLRGTGDLDASSSDHLGFTHAYRFNGHDNAIALDPTFARALAAVLFAWFQNVFLRLRPNRAAEMREVRSCLERALDLDRTDSQSKFAMGRIFWLEDRPDDGLPWLDTALAIDRATRGLSMRAA